MRLLLVVMAVGCIVLLVLLRVLWSPHRCHYASVSQFTVENIVTDGLTWPLLRIHNRPMWTRLLDIDYSLLRVTMLRTLMAHQLSWRPGAAGKSAGARLWLHSIAMLRICLRWDRRIHHLRAHHVGDARWLARHGVASHRGWHELWPVRDLPVRHGVAALWAVTWHGLLVELRPRRHLSLLSIVHEWWGSARRGVDRRGGL